MIERSFRLDEEMYMRLKEVADAESLPISYLVRCAVSRFLKAYEDDFQIIEVKEVDTHVKNR